MKKHLRYGLILCAVPFIMTACQGGVKPGTVSDGAVVKTEGQESGGGTGAGQESDGGTDVGQESDGGTGEGQESGGGTGAGQESGDGTGEGQESGGGAGAGQESGGSEVGAGELGDGYIMPDAASRLYRQEELEGLSREQLKLARNEIYARHGRKFKDTALQEYFQGKPWYQGTVAPEAFDEGRLNQTERDNLALVSRLEQERLNGREGYPTPPYAEAFAVWDSSHDQQKVSQKLFSDGGGTVMTSENSALIKHERYYEITDCEVWVDDVYDLSLFDSKKEGDRVIIDGTEMDITALERGEDGLRIYTLTKVSAQGKGAVEPAPQGWGTMARTVLWECSEGFYMKLDNDNCGPKKKIYEGSLYVYRDASIETGMMDGMETITAREYFETLPSKGDSRVVEEDKAVMYRRAGGLQEDGGILMMGIPEYDGYYYFTGFKEVSRNWIG